MNLHKNVKVGYFNQNYILELFIALEMVYYCCFSLGGNLDFLDFLQKKFYNIDYRWHKWNLYLV